MAISLLVPGRAVFSRMLLRFRVPCLFFCLLVSLCESQDETKSIWNLFDYSTGPVPSGRRWHSAVMCRDNSGLEHMLIYGGYSPSTPVGHADVWSTRVRDGLDKKKWLVVQDQNSPPTPRYAQTASVLNSVDGTCDVYVLGGTKRLVSLQQEDTNELFKFSFTASTGANSAQASWSVTYSQVEFDPGQSTPASFTLEPRAGHTSVAYNGRMYIFGGISGFRNYVQIHEQLLFYNPVGNRWTDLKWDLASRKRDLVWPQARYHHAAAVYTPQSGDHGGVAGPPTNSAFLIVYGGQGLENYHFVMLADVWSFRLSNPSAPDGWQKLKSGPGVKRSNFVMTMWNGYAVIFGGLENVDSRTYVYRDLYRINVNEMLQKGVTSKFEWARYPQTHSTNDVPEVRYGAAHVTLERGFLLNGGQFHDVYSDTWAVNLSRVLSWKGSPGHGKYEGIDQGRGVFVTPPWVYLIVVVPSLLLLSCIIVVIRDWHVRSRRVTVELQAIEGRRARWGQTAVSPVAGLPPALLAALPERTFSSKLDTKAECVICMDEYSDGDSIATLQCNHLFHKKCILSWLSQSTSCPMCRTQVSPPSNDELTTPSPV